MSRTGEIVLGVISAIYTLLVFNYRLSIRRGKRYAA